MAIYHLSVKAISRSAGRSATAAAAYRAACYIADERTGEIHDYTKKSGVESADIVLPDDVPEWAKDRAKLWNAAELAEKRKDSCVAREFEVALPSELSADERRRLALDFAKDMANREGCAVDVAIHAPGKGGDNRNHHAHILRTTRKIESDGLGEKLETEKAGRKRSEDLEAVRVRWAEMTNERLQENGIESRVDHRTLDAQGIEREPTKHLGVSATGYERRTGEKSDKRIRLEQEESEQQARAKQLFRQRTASKLAEAFLQAKTDDHYAELKKLAPVLAPAIDRLYSVREQEKVEFSKTGTIEARDKAIATIKAEKIDLVLKIKKGEPIPKPVENASVQAQKVQPEPEQQLKPKAPRMRM
jgi:ATP-dependent exoDNAse (exonuclease V) alpha subunit